MTTEFHTPNDVVGQAKNAVTCCVKFTVPDEFAHKMDQLYAVSLPAVKRMLANRKETSSKFYPEIPCVISKSLVAKYQRNRKCKAVSRLVIPICGDKGRQVKMEGAGIRVPALFKKAVIPVRLLKPIIGFPRQVEFFKRKGQWLGSLCYNTPRAATIKVTGAIGIDRNSVDNVAILADPQTGTVRRLGFNPARTKESLRGRRKNLQKAGKRRLLSKLRLKHSRRMTHENHRASKSIVDYAATHCRAVTLERLVGVNAVGSKIRRNSETQNWAFAQLESFLVYKCALRGVPVIWVDPAFTSQTCTHCWTRHKPVGKVFRCASCGRIVHKDVNAAFAIGYLGEDVLDGGSGSLNVLPLRCFGDARAGKVGCL